MMNDKEILIKGIYIRVFQLTVAMSHAFVLFKFWMIRRNLNFRNSYIGFAGKGKQGAF
jgi:hypothetical protein